MTAILLSPAFKATCP